MPTPLTSRRGLAAALSLLALAACGDPEPAPTLRVSADAPLAAVGADETSPPRPEGEPGTGSDGGAASRDGTTLVASLPGRAVVPPRPALPSAPRAAAAPDGARAAPRLTGRTAGGKAAIDLPLAHTRVLAQVSGNVARVEVTQFYVNRTADRLEAVYAFPLPPGAAVTDMTFRIGNRVVVSEVKRREEARRAYESAREQGRTAALTEQERPNLFTQSVANVPPGDTVAVMLRYVHEVPYDDGRYLFHFPTTIGPRYVPGVATGGGSGPGWAGDTDRVPDASRVTPPVVPTGAGGVPDVDILVRLVPGAAFDDVVARSHRVITGMDGDGVRLVALDEEDRAPDRDLVLTWRPAGEVPGAHALVQRERGEDFLMLFLQPPAEVAPALVRPKELVFLVDKSGSMMGAPIERAKALVDRALGAMGPDDTFQIVAFDGAAQAMTAAPVPGSAENVARARGWLSRLSGGGGTEMLAGIRAALAAPADPGRLRMVVFCTDGFIGNEAEIIAAVEALRGSARVFGFGVGTSVNRWLVEGVGRAGRGASEVVDLKDPPDEAVTRLFRRLDRPVLTDLEVAFEGGAVTDLLPGRLPDLLAGQPLVLAGRVRGDAPRAVVLTGRLGKRPWHARLPIVSSKVGADPAAPGQPVTGTLWARRRIEELLAPGPVPPAPAAVDEVVAHALRFKLVTRYTSFVAIERELRVDPSTPLATVAVPNLLPAGVSPEGIFGPNGVEVVPARVKPGDPELRVRAAASAVAVRVALPFERGPREAIRDEARSDWVLRFLVPAGWPDGSWDARVTIVHEGGRLEERSAPIRVDTDAAAIVVVAAPSAAARGDEVRIAMKPALPLGRVPALAERPGGLAAAVKGAIEVKEILVRSPWGEVARARLEGPLGVHVAVLRDPHDAPEGSGELELAASDAAGNVSRRRIPLEIRASASGSAQEVAYASVGGAIAFAAVVLGGAAAALLLRRRRSPFDGLRANGASPARGEPVEPRAAHGTPPRPLDRVLLAGTVKDARER
jgi:Ca-activated chloride channel family protein